MQVTLTKRLSSNNQVEGYDVRQIKKALNKLTYYKPLESTGITDIPDRSLFDAIKAFQADYKLPITGTIMPGDDTVKRLNDEISRTPDGYYIWRTVGDNKVRSSHATLNGTIRAWSDNPDPGEEFNYRCWAEPLKSVEKSVHNKNQLSVDLNDFERIYFNKEEHEITKGNKNRILLSHPTDMKHAITRFVRLDNGKELDMVHFMVVGRKGLVLGYMNEIQQLVQGSPSAFNPQDLDSNKLGIDFFRKYNEKIKQNPNLISKYIGEYLR